MMIEVSKRVGGREGGEGLDIRIFGLPVLKPFSLSPLIV